jgi:exoribonuclease II
VLGQFFLQERQILSNLPDLAAYLNFRIRNFSAFARIENLNTLSFTYGFGFKNANFAAPSYPMQDMVMRLGIFWIFVN